MRRGNTVDEYILAEENWQSELMLLREIILDTELKETVKWAAPVYTLQGKNVLGMAAFKNYVWIWFFQGVFLEDKFNKLYNAQEGKTKAMRQWRFSSMEEIEQNAKFIQIYMEEAIENQKQGKELKIARSTKTIEIPSELEDELAKNPSLKSAFENLTPGKQKEYAEYVSSAKREVTKQSRLGKIIPMIEQGLGLNDKYRSC